MPSSVLKFDTEENVRDEMALTDQYGGLFGLTTPKVKAAHFLEGVDPHDPSGLMQIDLCGGMFGLPEFASAPPVHTFASVIQAELTSSERKVDVVPIINEALERRMHGFTMSSRSVKKVDLASMYKIVRFVGHGVLNRAAEGAKRAKKAQALGAGFLNPPEIDDLDPEGCFVRELCGKRKTAKQFFKEFVSHEPRFTSKFERQVVLGLCHNDLHGGNLLLDSQGLVWLIDFATVKNDTHVLMDLTKFMASCLFLYLQENVTEVHIRTFAKLLVTTPDATTALPLVGGTELKKDKTATFVLDLLTRLRHCMCIYEVGDDAPTNDGVPFALALFSWSARMLSYNEPSLYQKSRALYFALAGAHRVLWEAGVEVGPSALEWIQEFRAVWEGQKGRRLSTSATQVQNLEFEFEQEFPRYLAQVGTAEAWSTDFLTREKVHATDHCTAVSVSFSGRLFPRYVALSPVAKATLQRMHPIHERYLKPLLELEHFYGRLLILGNSGSGKSMLTRQLFSEIAQQQLIDMSKNDQKVQGISVVPLRLPLVDLGRFLEAEPDLPLDADPVSDLLTTWVQKKYGQDSVPHKLIMDVRNNCLSESHRRSSVMSSDSGGRRVSVGSKAADAANFGARLNEIRFESHATGLFLLLDGYDEVSSHKQGVLQYMSSLLQSEPAHVTVLTSRPTSIGNDETETLTQLGFASFMMSELTDADAEQIARVTLTRMKESPENIEAIAKDIRQDAYSTLRRVPLILTLLIHVIRKVNAQAAPCASQSTRTAEALKKTEIYQRAVRLILHQSDAAKFALREGQSDQAMVRRLEMLKSVRARKLFQTISWHCHTKRARSFRWADLAEVSNDAEMLTLFREAFDQGRMPIFEKVDSAGDPMVQFNHLSFQELMAGEYASAILQHAHSNSATEAYINFFTSNSSKSLERDRLSEMWWIQVWMHVCEMVHPDAFKEWCAILAQDEQAKLKVGKIFSFSGCGENCRWIVKEVYWDEAAIEAPARMTCLQAMLQGYPPLILKGKVHMHSAEWHHEGVATLLRHAVRTSQRKLIASLLDLKVHYGLYDEGGESAFAALLMDVALPNLDLFLDRKVLFAPTFGFHMRNRIFEMWAKWKTDPKNWEVLGYSPAVRAMRRLPECWVLQQARSGTLTLTPEIDPNFAEPSTKLTPLMVAAGSGQVDLLRTLLENRADVHAEDAARCTALTFAAECSKDEPKGTLECMKLLLNARADVNHKSGRPDDWIDYARRYGRVLGSAPAVALMGGREKLELLCDAGYDLAQDTIMPVWFKACLGSNMDILRYLKDKVDISEPLRFSIPEDKEGPFVNGWQHLASSLVIHSKDVVRFILDAKVDINEIMGRGATSYSLMFTAMATDPAFMVSQDTGHLTELLDRGFALNRKNRKGELRQRLYTPYFVFTAIFLVSNPAALMWLFDNKVDLTVKNFLGSVWKNLQILYKGGKSVFLDCYRDWEMMQAARADQ
uniref:Uncharacterized protein n=1 Tax=Pyrodinium bahamense TaxID=73915 RepID=A0A7S0FFN2_9DINO|mmetsp:Transcript_26796/g.73661  ORF Transcript_26796/g.73661 Transcript_26796/m.73661 type:complete len:1470 (+) Transcript_26796:440-4849(+)